MKAYKLFYFLLMPLFLSCADKVTTETNIYKNYINTNYLKCLENELPCECYTRVTSISIDSSYVEMFGGGIEPISFPYEIKNDTLFPATDEEEIDENSMFNFIKSELIDYIVLQNDSLIFHNKDRKVVLTALEKEQYDSLDVYYFQQRLNLDFLVNKINDKEFVNDLGINQNTSLSCNAMMGINLIWNTSTRKKWILEKENDSIVVYSDISQPNLTVPIIVEKEFYKKYKW